MISPMMHQYRPSSGAADHVSASLTLNHNTTTITTAPSNGSTVPRTLPLPPCTLRNFGELTNHAAAISTNR